MTCKGKILLVKLVSGSQEKKVSHVIFEADGIGSLKKHVETGRAALQLLLIVVSSEISVIITIRNFLNNVLKAEKLVDQAS